MDRTRPVPNVVRRTTTTSPSSASPSRPLGIITSRCSFRSSGTTKDVRFWRWNVPTTVERARSRISTTTPSGLLPRRRPSIRAITRSPSIALPIRAPATKTSGPPSEGRTNASPRRPTDRTPSTFRGGASRRGRRGRGGRRRAVIADRVGTTRCAIPRPTPSPARSGSSER